MSSEAGSEPSARGPYAKGVARRQQIIDIAIAEFAQRGVDGASLRTVGEAIGVSHAALRHYFGTRDELLVEVYRAHDERSTPVSDGRSAVEIVAASAEENRTIPGLVQLYATLSTDALQQSHPLTTDYVRERFARIRTGLADLIREGQATGAVAADIDPVDAASLVIAASDGLQIQWLLDPETVDVSRVLSLLARLLPAASTAS
jgi:AcrR family transcriptional regulator